MITISITTPCLKDFPGLHHMRIPVCNSASPTEADFDILVQTLVGTTINCPVIISDQVTADQVFLLERSGIIQSKWANFRLQHSSYWRKNFHITFNYLLTGGTLESDHWLCRSLRLQGVPDLRLL